MHGLERDRHLVSLTRSVYDKIMALLFIFVLGSKVAYQLDILERNLETVIQSLRRISRLNEDRSPNS